MGAAMVVQGTLALPCDTPPPPTDMGGGGVKQGLKPG